ncbi:hypothetical protein [Burkholderia plantarii]|uniref:hypothetical protein n=1 Tax=Burkholderia plantarii TaxID=41899 RepID=UPI0006D88D32|nr:hypothetical protein [Burkholderia plantarii]ALK34941.1 hypothetical protein bpln_2g27490 [Burkholderia plantarii]GLZ18606.1 hypothetical protein Bpla01_21360 [Burkholderia plantarii]
MKAPDFLIARPAAHDEPGRFAIGETGFSFSGGQRPANPLAAWMGGRGIPARAARVLGERAEFAGMAALIGVATESDASHDPAAEWLLARAASGLVSIVVRDARGSRREQVRADTRLALAAARQYRAAFALVLLQAGNARDAATGCAALREAFGCAGAVEPDWLHAARVVDVAGRDVSADAVADVPVWFASLTAAD